MKDNKPLDCSSLTAQRTAFVYQEESPGPQIGSAPVENGSDGGDRLTFPSDISKWDSARWIGTLHIISQLQFSNVVKVFVAIYQR